MSPRAALALSLAALAAAGCRAPVTIAELDTLNRSLPTRTVLLEPELSLYSPFDRERTERYLALVEEERAAVAALFGVESAGPPIVVRLEPVADLGPSFEVVGDSLRVELPGEDRPLYGVEGKTSADTIVVFVSEDFVFEHAGRRLVGEISPDTYRAVLRHELAHVLSRRAGLEGGLWLREGVAELAEGYLLVDGELVPTREPALLRGVAELPAQERSLERLLAWREDVLAIEAGREAPWPAGRPVAHAFVRFLLEREGEPEGAERVAALRRAARRERAELRALQPEWDAWLAAWRPGA